MVESYLNLLVGISAMSQGKDQSYMYAILYNKLSEKGLYEGLIR